MKSRGTVVVDEGRVFIVAMWARGERLRVGIDQMRMGDEFLADY